MRNAPRRLAAIARTALVVAAAIVVATPAAAQFGGLKKKLKSAAAQEAVSEAVGQPEETGTAPAGPGAVAAAEPAGNDDGGAVVLTDDVIGRLITGLKAAEAQRKAAREADTPYGNYHKAKAAYEVAQPKCQEEKSTFYSRMATDKKLNDKYNAVVKQMMDAQGRGDLAAAEAYNDSARAIQGPSCSVREPNLPNDFYEVHRDVDFQAEQTAMKQSGFSRSELSQVRERTEMVLRKAPPSDLSASEKSAVESQAAQLKTLLNISDA
jgi:hypothetical protein